LLIGGDGLACGICIGPMGPPFTRGLEVVQAKGDHLSLVRDERNTAALALQINAALDRSAHAANKERSADRRYPTLVN
jgi:hypothetical protein